MLVMAYRRSPILPLINRAAIVPLTFLTAGFATADVRYDVDVRPSENSLHVVMTLHGSNRGSQLQIPNWAPGAYVLGENYKSVKNLKAHDEKGTDLKVEQEIRTVSKVYQDGTLKKTHDIPICTWKVAPSRTTVVEYEVPARLTDGAVHWSGPQAYLYEPSHRLEKCRLVVKVPDGWPVYVGLDEIKDQRNTYTARTYDVLADNPVSTGDLTVDSYVVRGKTHWIVMRGAAKSKVKRDNLIKACKFVSESETEFFRGAPYNKYVWHFAVNDSPDGGGGLEHLSSTQITMAAGVGPRVRNVLAHEFFHLWNVKRIRSKVLGPFDYTQLPETGALWWLEGVTDYFAFTLPHRYGGIDDQAYFAAIASNVQAVRNNPAYSDVGPNESSLRVDESNGGRGNSNGYLISYYNLGWLAGMCLDIELRSLSGGKHSIDDVEYSLWNLCKNDKPGFDEGEIRRQFVRLGGEEMGRIYDRIVMKGAGMALEETLAKVGLKLEVKSESYVDLGFNFGAFPAATDVTIMGSHGTAEGKLGFGDRLIAINGTNLSGDTPRAKSQDATRMTQSAEAGKPIKVTIKRNDELIDVVVTPTSRSREVYTVTKSPNATDAQIKLGATWLATRKLHPEKG